MSQKKKQQNSSQKLWFHIAEIVLNVAIIAAVVIGVRTFLISPFQVDGDSMLSTLENNEYILINKLTYFIDIPKRGDVVVLRPPTHDYQKHYVKRIIGIPGDEVIIREGYVYIRTEDSDQEERLSEPYLNEHNYGQTYHQFGSTEEKRYQVPADHYFLLGDNRRGSLDSRSFVDNKGEPQPFVHRSDVKGKVWYVVLPVSKIHAVETPEYEL